ncbi:MAG: NusA-like transcription termination signal-binding factor [Candidatus Thermoplasmatota archaeon]
MPERLLSNETVQYIKMIYKHTRAEVIDCISEDDRVFFVVSKGQLGLAIGPKARNLEHLRALFKKNVKFVEYDDDKKTFIYNLCKPYKVKSITIDESDDNSFIARIEADPADKSKLIGKNGRNINIIRKLAQRHHPIKDVQII